jgi:hypothetical protein
MTLSYSSDVNSSPDYGTATHNQRYKLKYLWERHKLKYLWERHKLKYLWERHKLKYLWERHKLKYLWDRHKLKYLWDRHKLNILLQPLDGVLGVVLRVLLGRVLVQSLFAESFLRAVGSVGFKPPKVGLPKKLERS